MDIDGDLIRSDFDVSSNDVVDGLPPISRSLVLASLMSSGFCL